MADTQSALRQHVLYLLEGGGAHVKFQDAIAGLAPKLRGVKPDKLDVTPWAVLEHMRLAQADILEFCLNRDYREKAFPADYWPTPDAPPDPRAWDKSVKRFEADLNAMCALVRNPRTDLFAKIPWGDGQTYLREALLVADHNAYHLGQMITVRRLLGAWK
ncbi:MAG: DinB family protein [Acidobacteria bacterium]|nr:DinB family protein [Acidobacteriaceae bacterium]MBV9609767.1 DinB family protein [Acidobacteriota bacterium]